jgi:hypothetical protein
MTVDHRLEGGLAFAILWSFGVTPTYRFPMVVRVLAHPGCQFVLDLEKASVIPNEKEGRSNI